MWNIVVTDVIFWFYLQSHLPCLLYNRTLKQRMLWQCTELSRRPRNFCRGSPSSRTRGLTTSCESCPSSLCLICAHCVQFPAALPVHLRHPGDSMSPGHQLRVHWQCRSGSDRPIALISSEENTVMSRLCYPVHGRRGEGERQRPQQVLLDQLNLHSPQTLRGNQGDFPQPGVRTSCSGGTEGGLHSLRSWPWDWGWWEETPSVLSVGPSGPLSPGESSTTRETTLTTNDNDKTLQAAMFYLPHWIWKVLNKLALISFSNLHFSNWKEEDWNWSLLASTWEIVKTQTRK